MEERGSGEEGNGERGDEENGGGDEARVERDREGETKLCVLGSNAASHLTLARRNINLDAVHTIILANALPRK